MPLALDSKLPLRWYSHSYNRAGLYRLASALGRLPRPLRLTLARRIGRLAPGAMPAERAAVEKALARFTGATGARLKGLTTRVFSDFAMCFSDLVSTNRLPRERLTRYVAKVEGVAELSGRGGGLISLTAHVGNWDLAGRLLAGRTVRPTHVVVAPEEAGDLEQWVRRNGDGVRFVVRSRATVSLQLLAALRRGEVVGMQGDRALGTRGDILLPFFGAPAPFPLGPFLLAARVGAPVVPAFCVLDADDRYVVKLSEPFTVRRGAEEDAARQWVAVLEDIVGRYPTQWFNFFDIWAPFA